MRITIEIEVETPSHTAMERYLTANGWVTIGLDRPTSRCWVPSDVPYDPLETDEETENRSLYGVPSVPTNQFDECGGGYDERMSITVTKLAKYEGVSVQSILNKIQKWEDA